MTKQCFRCYESIKEGLPSYDIIDFCDKHLVDQYYIIRDYMKTDAFKVLEVEFKLDNSEDVEIKAVLSLARIMMEGLLKEIAARGLGEY